LEENFYVKMGEEFKSPTIKFETKKSPTHPKPGNTIPKKPSPLKNI